jgi:hypothetical protein
LHFSTAVSLEDFLVFLLEMADYISGAWQPAGNFNAFQSEPQQ